MVSRRYGFAKEGEGTGKLRVSRASHSDGVMATGGASATHTAGEQGKDDEVKVWNSNSGILF